MPPKKASGEGPPAWWDESWAPRNVEFKISVEATFHPSADSASLSIPWLDAAGQLTPQPVVVGPFSSFDLVETASPNKRWPGAVTARTEKSLGSLAVSHDLIHGLQTAALPITLTLGGEKHDSLAGSAARIHPGPLLLANDQEDAAAALPKRPQEVAAVLTETIGFAGIYRLDVRISTDIPVLSTEMLYRLMPVCFTVEAVRGLPNELWLDSKCKDVFVEVYPQVGSINTQRIAEECPRHRSSGRPHNTLVKFADPTVWLLGAAPFHAVREWIQSEELVVEVHDRDLKPEDAHDTHDEQAKQAAERKRKRLENTVHPHGIARFKLAPLMQARSLTMGLRADVFPARGNNKQLRAEVGASLRAADVLGEGGKQAIAEASAFGKTEVAPDYLASGSVCTVRATLAVPVPNARELQERDEAQEQEEWAGKEVLDGEEGNIYFIDDANKEAEEDKKGKDKKKGKEKKGSQIDPSMSPPKLAAAKAAPTKRCRAKVSVSEDEEPVHGPWRGSKEEAERDERELLAAVDECPVPEGDDIDEEDLEAMAAFQARRAEAVQAKVDHVKRAAASQKGKKTLGVDRRYERYGRVVMAVDDSDIVTIKTVLNCIRELNGTTLGIDPRSAEMLTREFHPEERANAHLDVLTGFSILDGNSRVMVIEGLREHGLKKLLEAVPRNQQPNSEGYKLLQNPDIGFSERLYWDFGPKLKQLRIRMPLEDLAAKPELYCVLGTINEEIRNGMKVPATLMAIKKADRFQPLRQGSNFPPAAHVAQLEILYGDYISDNMLEGDPVAHEREPTYKKTMRSTAQTLKGALADSLALDDFDTTRNAHGRMTLPCSTLQHSRNKRDIMEKTGTATAFPRGTTTMKTQVLRDLPVALPDPPTPRTAMGSQKEQMVNNHFTQTLNDRMRKTASAPNMRAQVIRKNKDKVKQRSDANAQLNHILNRRQERQTPFLNGQEVFMYSGQKHNCVEKQKEWMRETMATQQAHTMYSYGPTYSSQNFELTAEGAESGIRQWQGNRPNDTYARAPGDNREVWRSHPARPKEEFRKPPNSLDNAGGDELHEPFCDGEWFKLPIGEDRHKPTKVHVRYEPSKIPHERRITERPFDKSQITVMGEDFGPRSMFSSVHYNAHGAPGNDRHADVEGHNVTLRDEHQNKIHGNKFLRTFSQGETRRGVTSTDKQEVLLKDDPTMVLRGSGVDDPLPTSIRIFEPYQHIGNPSVEFQARLRENDTSAPYDVASGGYIKRDPNIGKKMAVQSGTLGRAPWRHGATEGFQHKQKGSQYVSQADFSTIRNPGKSIHDESHLWKNATRMSISKSERSLNPYRRPVDYGVQIPAR